MTQTFMEYLMERCMDDTHALDDMLPDVFEDWLGELDVDDLVSYAEIWHKEQLEISVNKGVK